jgi:diguanylate cyclase (GGDEF)-like protein/PAS domain S-box-containing protein
MFALRQFETTRRAALYAAGALLVAVTVTRFLFPEPTNGIGLFYLLPICVIAVEFGWRAGVALAVLSSGIVTAWAALSDEYVSMGGNISRLLAYAAVGWLVGVLVQERDEMEAESARWFAMSNGLLCVAGLDGSFTRVNPAWTDVLGYTPKEMLTEPFAAFVHPDDLERTQECVAGLAAEPSSVVNFENRFRASGGSWHWLSWSASSDGHQIYAVAKDITERKNADRVREARLREAQAQAHADDLTGLGNRRAWDSELPREISRSKRTGAPLSVAILDLDGLKSINDTQGHQAGSNAIKHAAAAWSNVLRDSDMIARYGGDEFVVMMPDSTLAQAQAVAERLRYALGSGPTVSIGIAEWDGEETPDALIERADAALYEAKDAGRDRVVGARPAHDPSAAV